MATIDTRTAEPFMSGGKNWMFYTAIAAVVLAGAAWIGSQTMFLRPPTSPTKTDARLLAKSPIDGQAAYEHLEALCALGPRPTGSPGMQAQQKLLIKHFESLGAKVREQPFEFRHPLDGSTVTGKNLIVELHPDRPERVLVAAHYDTRPYPDRDPRNPRGRFVGANDGGSGTALLMQLAADVQKLPGKLGVDLVLFDAEEFVFDERNPKYFVGSEHFARNYAAAQGPVRYRQGVLLDMVGDADLQILAEPNSIQHARATTNAVWETARRLGIREFVAAPMQMSINDDHMPLNTIAHVPTCDIIDFQYPAWHTESDNAEHCSGESLAKVGWVVYEWLKTTIQ